MLASLQGQPEPGAEGQPGNSSPWASRPADLPGAFLPHRVTPKAATPSFHMILPRSLIHHQASREGRLRHPHTVLRNRQVPKDLTGSPGVPRLGQLKRNWIPGCGIASSEPHIGKPTEAESQAVGTGRTSQLREIQEFLTHMQLSACWQAGSMYLKISEGRSLHRGLLSQGHGHHFCVVEMVSREHAYVQMHENGHMKSV